MFGPIVEMWAWVKANNPVVTIKKRRLNFITIHYIYILSLAIVGSILLYPVKNIAYIDALFFASGCATQSGLNTVDVNTLTTYQQVIFYFMAMVATPIFINTFVVFVRLYWFERRFQHIVKEARTIRRTRSRSRTKTEARRDQGPERLERGVRGRSIVVLHKADIEQAEAAEKQDPTEDSESPSASNSSHGDADKLKGPPEGAEDGKPSSFHRDIMFADQLGGKHDVDSPTYRLPQRVATERNIAFLENQRNPKDKGILRIPGPREFDMGDTPKALDEHDDESKNNEVANPVDGNGERMRRHVTIDEPDNHPPRADTGLLPRPSTRKNSNLDMNEAPTDAPTEVDEKLEKLPFSARLRVRSGTFNSLRNFNSHELDPMPYLSWQATVGRNSAFVDLTEEQREELGGIEYRSLKTLAIVLVSYYVIWHLLGVVVLLPWILHTQPWGSVVDNDGQSRVWWGIFTPASMFNDLGFTLTPDSMESFQNATLPLLFGSFLIIIGNTGFPCMLRLIIWVATKLVPLDSGVWEEFRFLLDHPRRCFTLLFPNKATWWLFWILVILNGLDLIFFIALDVHDPTVTMIDPPGYRVLNGLFQAASTRTAGFASVDLANLHPGIQVSYMIMMYISVLPIAISVRRTNVYEEKSLGIYGSASQEDEDGKDPSYVGAHLRRQLSFDLWYIFLGLFIIAIAEGSHIENTNEYAFTLFSCLFEIVSAYGTVGLSLGYPNIDASFSAKFSVVSKLVIIAMQIRGRHRGLPYELDRAILLPSESLHEKEDADASKRMHRRDSNLGSEAAGSPFSRTPTNAQSPELGKVKEEPDNATTTGRDQQENGYPSKVKHHPGHARRALGKVMAGLATGPRPGKKDGVVLRG